jgi:hypothetical protein
MADEKENIVLEKSFAFAIRAVTQYRDELIRLSTAIVRTTSKKKGR